MNNSFVIEQRAQCVSRQSPIGLTNTFNCPQCGSHMFVFSWLNLKPKRVLEKVEEREIQQSVSLGYVTKGNVFFPLKQCVLKRK